MGCLDASYCAADYFARELVDYDDCGRIAGDPATSADKSVIACAAKYGWRAGILRFFPCN
jgi:hypothetical protein